MDYGALIFPTKDSIDPASLGQLLEREGFESLFVPDHSHIPSSRKTPFPGGELPAKYTQNLETFVALTAAATATTRLRVGSGVCLLVQRDPIYTAKIAASIDVLSGGRLVFGVGAGWNREEMEDHGTDPDTRFALLRERVEAMRAIWTQDEATYHGRFVDFDAIWSWPKPVQQPHPPVLLGLNGASAIERVLEYGDGWCPLYAPGVEKRVAELRAEAEARDRNVSVTVILVPPDPPTLRALADAGVDRCVFELPSAGAAEVERELEAIRRAIEQARA